MSTTSSNEFLNSFQCNHVLSSGLNERDAAFMQRLRNLAREALTWPHLGEKQRLVWAAVLELNAVPVQEPTSHQILSTSIR